ncbi:MAG: FeoB-associated Cys-rich membrane protein [Ruminococcaceae bacterium]|nr:FeoB-associated Cys-rich membrane protein [Oscillospiraceae bacterium]
MLWLSQNLATILISLVLIAVCALIIFRMRRNKKQGKSSCGCGCSTCAMKDMCHSQNEQKTKNTP